VLVRRYQTGPNPEPRAGLGLPVRDIADPEAGADPRTPLTWVGSNGRRDWIRYRSLMQLGAGKSVDGTSPMIFIGCSVSHAGITTRNRGLPAPCSFFGATDILD
jgi:hypothetical protein